MPDEASVPDGGLLLPAPVGEPDLVPAPEAAQPGVQYYFPVEVEVRAAPERVDPYAVAELALGWLADDLGGA
jgi:hypothetical protein